MYLENLLTVLIFVAKYGGFIFMVVMGIGFIASWLNEGMTYSAKKDRRVVDWVMPAVPRRFFRIFSPPVLLFGIPGLMTVFGA